jgi:hypothetical protein
MRTEFLDSDVRQFLLCTVVQLVSGANELDTSTTAYDSSAFEQTTVEGTRQTAKYKVTVASDESTEENVLTTDGVTRSLATDSTGFMDTKADGQSKTAEYISFSTVGEREGEGETTAAVTSSSAEYFTTSAMGADFSEVTTSGLCKSLFSHQALKMRIFLQAFQELHKLMHSTITINA